MKPLGTIMRTKDGRYILHHERDLRQSAANVWAAITDPAVLANWLDGWEAFFDVPERGADGVFMPQRALCRAVSREISPRR